MTPEEKARERIDYNLPACGWRESASSLIERRSSIPSRSLAAGRTENISSSMAGSSSFFRLLAEQHRIVARLSLIEDLVAMVATNLQRATRLRQSFHKRAFTGNLP